MPSTHELYFIIDATCPFTKVVFYSEKMIVKFGTLFAQNFFASFMLEKPENAIALHDIITIVFFEGHTHI